MCREEEEEGNRGWIGGAEIELDSMRGGEVEGVATNSLLCHHYLNAKREKASSVDQMCHTCTEGSRLIQVMKGGRGGWERGSYCYSQ